MRYTHEYAMLPERAFQRKLFGNSPVTLEGGGGGGQPPPAPSSSTVTNTNIPDYARPYVETMLGATQQQLFNTQQNPGTPATYDAEGNQTSAGTPGSVDITGVKPYTPYSNDPTAYFAGFSPLQTQVQQNVAGMQVPGQIADASNMAQQAGIAGLNSQYNPMTAGYNQVRGAQTRAAQLGSAPTAQAAQLGNAPTFESAQFGGPQNVNAQNVSTQDYTGQNVSNYMNPYLQSALQPQLAEMERQYGISGAQQQTGAARVGAFGGSREALMAAENQRNKNTAMNQAIGQGYNTAFTNAQQQFNTQQQANLQAQQANQGANLQAGLANQQMGYNTGLQNAQLRQQAGLANQQLAGQYGLQQGQFGQAANLANQALAGQYGLQQGQFGQAANLANQQSRNQANLANQQAQLQAQQQNIGQQQFGANYRLQGLQQANAAAQNLGNLGGQQLQAQQGIYGLQNQIGAQQQARQQDIINQQIQNYAVAQQYPQQQLSFMNAMLRGLPMQAGSTQMYQAAPSAVSQAAGLGTAGIAGLGLYNTMSGGKKAGGTVKKFAEGGIADIGKKVLLNPDKYSIAQIQGAMKNGVVNKLIGDPVLADKIKEQQMANAPQPQQQPTIDQQINQQAMQLSQSAPPPLPMQQQGLPAAQSNLPTFTANDGGIVAFGSGGDVAHFQTGGRPTLYPNDTSAFSDDLRGFFKGVKDFRTSAYAPFAKFRDYLTKPAPTPTDLDDQYLGADIKTNKAATLLPAPKNDLVVDRSKPPVAPPAAPAAPVVEPAKVPTIDSTGIDNLFASNKTNMDDLKQLILGSREDPDKALKQAGLMAALKGGFKMMSGTSPYALANIGAGGETAADELGRGIDRIQANKQAQVGQLVALGLKGMDLNTELQKLGITRDYYNMHAPLFAAQASAAAQQGPLYKSQANYYDARAKNPPGSGGMTAGTIPFKDLMSLKDKYATLTQNPKSDPVFFANLPKEVRNALNTSVDSPSYLRGLEAVKAITAKQFNQDIQMGRVLGAKKVPVSALSDLD